MGRVFSYEQAVSGGVPSLEDFSRATEQFCETVQAGIEDGNFDGGMVFGSVGRGTPNLRSDFDALIALSNDSTKAYRAAHDLTRYLTRESGGRILVEPQVYPRDVLASGHHDIDRFFGSHLVSGHRIGVGSNPGDYIKFNETPPSGIATSYAMQKARKLSSLYITTQPGEVTNNALQRMLELPNSLGRNVVEAMMFAGAVTDTCDGSDKETVAKLTNEIFRDLGVYDDFVILKELDSNYTKILKATVAGNIGSTTYNDELVAIHNEMPRAINWTRAVGRAVLPFLEKK